MPDVGLLLQLGEIAGIFVGFGALISVRGNESNDLFTVSTLRYVTWVGVWVLVSSLAPVAVSRFGVTGHAIWLPCAIFALIFLAALLLTDIFSPESKALEKSAPSQTRRLRALYLGVGGPIFLGLIGSLVLVILGVWPEAEQGLYFAALALGMSLAGLTLLSVVFVVPHEPR